MVGLGEGCLLEVFVDGGEGDSEGGREKGSLRYWLLKLESLNSYIYV